jgi:hypothetical protein
MTEGKKFPIVNARTLSGHDVQFPDISSGKVSLIAVAFVRGAQSMLDSWTEPFERACRGEVFEIPMIEGTLWKLVSNFIDSGMRSGIPDAKHDNVATYYGPTEEIRGKLGIEDTSIGYVFLLDENGTIIFEGKGYADEEGIGKILESAGNTCRL